MPEPDDFLAIAAIIADSPQWWQRLKAAHPRDNIGDCAGCPWEQAPRPRWPCALYALGAEAEKIHRIRVG